jgi:hypothetical protein
MRIGRCLLILSIVLISCQVKAQARLGVSVDSLPTSGQRGDTSAHTASMFIYNFGNQSITDSIVLRYEVDGTTYYSNNPGQGIYFFDTTSVSPGDSIKKYLQIHFTPTIFRTVGTSGVVIWPIAVHNTGLVPDTSSCFIDVTGGVGIAETSDQKLLVYMDGPQLVVKITGENLLKRVRIYTVSGVLLSEEEVSSSAIMEMREYASGLYLVRVTFVDESEKVFKIVNLAGR